MTEKEKMISGMLYDASDAELAEMRRTAHNLCTDYNALHEDETERREEIKQRLLGSSAKNVYLQGPVQFDYGVFTAFGKGCYVNFNLTVLDCCPVTFGKNVFIGPNCTFATPVHPMLPDERSGFIDENGNFTCKEYAKPITVGDNVWFASNVTVCAGVKVGDNCVIGAGSVVTRDIPPNTFAAGNPCRVIKPITDDMSVYK
jgi:maltose O-acetyltransferase